MQAYTMLQALSKLGVRTASFCGGIFDNPSGKERIPNFDVQLQSDNNHPVRANIDTSANAQNPIRHFFFTGFHSTRWDDITSGESTKFLLHYVKLLRRFKPDLVIGYGTDALSRALWGEARLFGIPTAYLLCNANHLNYRFPQHDALLCDSQATSDYYREKEGLTVHPIGNFINPAIVVAGERHPKTVTFINPSPQKGAAVVARLILMANRERPDLVFQVVESRQKFADVLRSLRAPGGKPGSAFKKATFKNLAVVPARYDVKPIYARTAVLIAPSLGFESWGRVASEAIMNGIPVLSSDSGGLPEAVGTAGITLEAPSECLGKTEAMLTLPSEASCRPWANALYRLVDERNSSLWQKRCQETAAQNTMRRCAMRLLTVLEPLLQRKAGDADFTRWGSIRFPNDPLP